MRGILNFGVVTPTDFVQTLAEKKTRHSSPLNRQFIVMLLAASTSYVNVNGVLLFSLPCPFAPGQLF